MGKVYKFLSLLIILPLLGLFALSGCSLFEVDWSINDGFDTEEYIPPDYDFSVSASLDKINVVVSNVGEYGESATLVALPIYQYLFGEEITGLSENNNSTPIELSSYECGTSQKFVFDRYFDDVDGIYLKYYVVSAEDEILAGPMFCTEIESIYQHEDPLPEAKSIKGVMCEDDYTDAVKDLGCSYTEINFVMDYMIAPNEYYNSSTGKVEQITYIEGENDKGEFTISDGNETWAAEYIDYNGQRYYFRLDVGDVVSLRHYDEIIKKYTDDGIRVTLIMLLHNVNNPFLQPYYICYPATAGDSSALVQLNTSNMYGANYWGAFMEFLAKRYSAENSKYGNVQTYVLGNEIDASSTWNKIVAPNQPPLTLENYVEEYERQMRIADLATKKYYQINQILVSITHYWVQAFEEYSPKAILDYMTLKTLKQGNYDYGFAIHPYGVDLGDPEFWSNDLSYSSMNGSLNTSSITWSNLEVIQLYLEQTSKLINGKVRSVYLTEGGVSSSSGNSEMFEKTKNQQAAGIAYLYYKSTQLSCIKAVIYYRLVDAPLENAYFGLCTPEGIKKPAYDVYKYIDTQYSFEVSDPYLKYITWTVSLGPGRPPYAFGQEIGNVNSYKDTMKLFASKFDWSNWNEDLITTRIIEKEEYLE